MSHVFIHNSWKEWLGGTKRNLFSFVHLLHTRHLRNAFLTKMFEYLYLCANDINVQNHSRYNVIFLPIYFVSVISNNIYWFDFNDYSEIDIHI